MYDLANVAHDFPWTAVSVNAIEPWREEGTNWFNEIPEGWGDVIFDGLTKMDTILEEYNAKDRFVTEQVKEKWGQLRWYFYVRNPDDEFQQTWGEEPTESLQKIVDDMEEETGLICCYCGTRNNVKGYGGWVHYACENCEAEAEAKREAEYQEWLSKHPEYAHKKGN